MKKRYKIVVTEWVEETTLTSRVWTKCGNPGQDGGYDYTPQIPQQEIVEREIYTQNVDTLDIRRVIDAVNGDSAQEAMLKLQAAGLGAIPTGMKIG